MSPPVAPSPDLSAAASLALSTHIAAALTHTGLSHPDPPPSTHDAFPVARRFRLAVLASNPPNLALDQPCIPIDVVSLLPCLHFLHPPLAYILLSLLLNYFAQPS